MNNDDRCSDCYAPFVAGQEILLAGGRGWRHARAADCDIAGLLARFTTDQLQAEIDRRRAAA
jgi:hypothetical protein